MTNGTGRRHMPAARTITDRTSGGGARDARLVAAVRERDDPVALEELVTGHLGLVRGIARRNAGSRDQVDDLVQEGVIGLLKAIRRFEPRRGVPFEAYASALVAGEIRHHVRDRSSCLRLPEPVRELRSRLRRLAAEARAETGREPELASLASAAGVSERAAAEAALAGSCRSTATCLPRTAGSGSRSGGPTSRCGSAPSTSASGRSCCSASSPT